MHPGQPRPPSRRRSDAAAAGQRPQVGKIRRLNFASQNLISEIKYKTNPLINLSHDFMIKRFDFFREELFINCNQLGYIYN